MLDQRQRAREEELYATQFPLLQAEYRTRLAVFIEKLRRRCRMRGGWPVFAALVALTNVSVQPWQELRVLPDDSRFRAWMAQAIEAGFAK